MRPSRLMTLALAALGIALAATTTMAAEVVAVEFYSPASNRYFITANPGEIGLLGKGAFADWYRTGGTFHVDDAPGDGLVPVCRFYSDRFGVPTHFYTADAGECATVKAYPQVTYEGIAFYTPALVHGECPAGTLGLARYFSNSYDGSPNHVYAATSKRIDTLVEAGFTDEGIGFCVPLLDPFDPAKVSIVAESRWDLPLFDTYQLYDPLDPEIVVAPHVASLVFTGPVLTAEPALSRVRGFNPWFTYFVYEATQYASEAALGWNPFFGRYEANVYWGDRFDPFDAIGAAFVFDWSPGSPLESCARPIVLDYRKTPGDRPHLETFLQRADVETCGPGSKR